MNMQIFKIKEMGMKIAALEEELWKKETSILKKDSILNKIASSQQIKPVK